MTEKLLGIDIGSTTLKLCLLWQDGTTEPLMLAHEGDLFTDRRQGASPAVVNEFIERTCGHDGPT